MSANTAKSLRKDEELNEAIKIATDNRSRGKVMAEDDVVCIAEARNALREAVFVVHEEL